MAPVEATVDPATLHVEGNHLMVGTKIVQLNGFSHSGTEYMCKQGRGIFEGKVNNAAIDAMLTWHPHIIRVTLNEDCWLGINGIKPQYGGTSYQQAMAAYVQRLEAHGLYVDLDLHYAAPGTKKAGESNMADADHSPEFWREVATEYGADRKVLFELYNEPHGISWKCLRDGCETHGFRAAGYQTLVDTVRATGATNIVLVGTRIWDGDLSHWLEFKPNDPLHQVAAVVHLYDTDGCLTKACISSIEAKVARHVPLVTTEFGTAHCGTDFVGTYMSWADAHGVSYLAWTWNAWPCAAVAPLITAYDGHPTALGKVIRAHFRKRF